MKITAKRVTSETGLMGVTQLYRGYDLRINGEDVGVILPSGHSDMFSKDYKYWKVLFFGDSITGLKRCYLKKQFAFTDEGLQAAKQAALKFLKSKVKEQ